MINKRKSYTKSLRALVALSLLTVLHLTFPSITKGADSPGKLIFEDNFTNVPATRHSNLSGWVNARQSGILAPIDTETNHQSANSWRTMINANGNPGLGLYVGSNRSGEVKYESIVTYNYDWSQYSSGKISFELILGNISPETEVIISFGNEWSERNDLSAGYNFILTGASTKVKFSSNIYSSEANLPKNIADGSRIKIELTNQRNINIWVDDQRVMNNQPAQIDENFIQIAARSPALDRKLRRASIRTFTVRIAD
ncbi:hypothetical protein QEH59_01245 [Coraliomargarita sp. SDUM461004]|uniref:3-keto-disaccharide hydrolase domain-containing protein n=1 Tax=Thalassobacterium sedimentorum TaxID=3041258 RepID=A0ABU1AE40_9BACT|nr:hypothetical protein [Coraliomargarita sp. SDUM461004]MDQ8193031.1 hypothetical protein [Coraliomargarita sp. SDUM461004]